MEHSVFITRLHKSVCVAVIYFLNTHQNDPVVRLRMFVFVELRPQAAFKQISECVIIMIVTILWKCLALSDTQAFK